MTDMTNQMSVRGFQAQDKVWDEKIFHYLLMLEQRRSRRSYNPFALMLLNAMEESDPRRSVLQFAMPAITSSIRETDLIGWIENPRVLGIIFTQVDLLRTGPDTMIPRARLETALREKLGHELAKTIAISLHVFPEYSGDLETNRDPAERFAFSAT